MKTLVIGASLKPERYSYKAIKKLRAHNYEVVAIGLRKGEIADVSIENDKEPFSDVDTVTMYVNPSRQEDYIDYILSLKPRRVIFNPGTENFGFQKTLSDNSIQFENACTLVLLATNQY